MQHARYVRTLAFFLGLGLAGLAGGCGPGTPSPAETKEAEETISKEHRGRHEELKAVAKQKQADANKFEGKGSHRRGR